MAKKKIEARTNPVVSDLRKESETFQFLTNGRSPIEEIEEYASAISRDYACGFINGKDVKTLLAPVDAHTANMRKTIRAAKKRS